MKNFILLIIVLNTVCSTLVKAQTSLLQDKSGETSILLNDKKSIFVNAGDESVSLNLSFNRTKWFIGTNLKFKSVEGVSVLLDGYKFKPQFDLTVFGGNGLKSNKEYNIQFLYYSLKGTISNFNILNSDSLNTFDEKEFIGCEASVGYNLISAISILKSKDGMSSSVLFGASVNYSLINNIEDLKPVQRYTTHPSGTDSTQTTLMSDKASGFSGDYLSYGALRVNVDAFIYPQIIGGQIGIGGYFRSQVTGKTPRCNAGIGIVVGQKDAPTNVVFGIMYQFNDIFNQLKKENDFVKRGGINIVAGYNF